MLAVEIHQRGPTSSDISFDLELIASDSAQVVRGPYLQQGTDDSVIIKWRTNVPTDSRVQYGTSLANLDSMTDDNNVDTEHEIQLTGLNPETTYYYSTGTTAETLAGGDTNHFFITSPLPGTVTPTRIWTLGD